MKLMKGLLPIDPTYAILGHKDQTPHINELKSLKVIGWTWENIKRAISQM